jgi:TRAP-type C4-dicarboxylate transport system substrate-binding protein
LIASLLVSLQLSTANAVVTLKVHHFLPAASSFNVRVIQPWCEKIAKESNGEMVCQIYPSMQLGGTPPQLVDQVKDGVVDIVWVIPTYAAGRFTKSEVFELPFLTASSKQGSQALWSTSTKMPWMSTRVLNLYLCILLKVMYFIRINPLRL